MPAHTRLPEPLTEAGGASSHAAPPEPLCPRRPFGTRQLLAPESESEGPVYFGPGPVYFFACVQLRSQGSGQGFCYKVWCRCFTHLHSHNHKQTPFPPERLTPQPRLRLLPRTNTNLWVVAAHACPSNLCSPSWWPCPAQPLQHQCQWQWQYQCQCQYQSQFQRQCQSQCQRQCQSQRQRQRSCGYRPQEGAGTVAPTVATRRARNK